MKQPACISLVVAAALAASAMATPVVASNTSSITVSYKDLDLAKSSGARELRARVNQAATKVCAFEATRDCQKAAVAGAEPQVALALANTASRSRATPIAVSAH